METSCKRKNLSSRLFTYICPTFMNIFSKFNTFRLAHRAFARTITTETFNHGPRKGDKGIHWAILLLDRNRLMHYSSCGRYVRWCRLLGFRHASGQGSMWCSLLWTRPSSDVLIGLWLICSVHAKLGYTRRIRVRQGLWMGERLARCAACLQKARHSLWTRTPLFSRIHMPLWTISS